MTKSWMRDREQREKRLPAPHAIRLGTNLCDALCSLTAPPSPNSALRTPRYEPCFLT